MPGKKRGGARRGTTSRRVPLVFLFDLDDTLLDHDAIQQDLRRHLEREYGKRSGDRYFRIFDRLRTELGYPDYMGALERYRRVAGEHAGFLLMASYLVDYPFRKRVYPGALKAVDHAKKLGRAVILTDGDVVLQPRKIERSGLWQRVQGHVLVCTHKEKQLREVLKNYPADHYVVIEDRRKVLRAIKTKLGARVTTVFVEQGRVAGSMKSRRLSYEPDMRLRTIGEFARVGAQDFVRAGQR